jgi:type IV secretory pathway TrbF-like protein
MTPYIERLMSFVQKGNEGRKHDEEHEPHFYGDGDEIYISQAYNWRLIAIIEAIALIIIVIFCVNIAAQDRFIPYVITIAEDGSTFTARAAQHASTIDESVVQAQLKQFIVKARSVVNDRIVQESNINTGAYSMARRDARAFLDAWYQVSENDPYERMSKVLVEVNVTSIVRSGDSRLMTWTETIRDIKDGTVTSVEPWEATVKIEFSPPPDVPARYNPLGMYITSLNWTKKI